MFLEKTLHLLFSPWKFRHIFNEHIKPENLPTDLHRLHYVLVGVLVDKDGTLLYPEIVYGNHKGLNEEAMRIVSLICSLKKRFISSSPPGNSGIFSMNEYT